MRVDFELSMLDLHQNFFLFVGLNALVFSTANTVIWRYFADEMRDVFDWVIMMFLVMCTEILFVLGLVGFLGQLNVLWVSVGVGMCFLLGGVKVPMKKKGPFSLGGFEAWRCLRNLTKRQDVLKGQEWIFAVFGFLILFGVVELFNAFVQYPWEYDTLAYHMPMVVEWLQSGSLWEIFYAVWGGPLGYYPGHHELLVTWFVLPFGTDLLANLLNFGVVGVTLVVLYKILKEVGVDDFLAWLAGALVMVMPIFLRQIGTGQVDLLMALGVVLGWYLMLRSFKRRDGLLLIPLLMDFALLLGTKYLSILYIIPLLVVFLLFFKTWYKQTKWWWAWTLFFLGWLGSMWYWRNLVITGNPIFPAGVSFGGWTLFEGYAGLTDRIQELSLWHRITESGEWSLWVKAMIKETGWHMYLVVGAYVILVVELIYKLFFSRLQRGEGRIYTLMLFFLPAYWYLYFIAPYTASMMEHNVRYAMPWLMLAMIMVMYTVYKSGVLRKVFVMGLLGLLWWQFLQVVFSQRIGLQLFFEPQFVYQHGVLFLSMIGVIALFMAFIELWRRQSLLRFFMIVVCVLASYGFLVMTDVVRADMRQVSWEHKYGFPLMKAYEWLDDNASDDAVVANTLNPLYYPLYGSELTRKVRYININDCGDCDYYEYHSKRMTLRENPSYAAWRANLEDAEVDYLVVGYSIAAGLESVTPHEVLWLEEHADEFEKVFGVEGASIYELKDAEDAQDSDHE